MGDDCEKWVIRISEQWVWIRNIHNSANTYSTMMIVTQNDGESGLHGAQLRDASVCAKDMGRRHVTRDCTCKQTRRMNQMRYR
jgi:hypothetical protein